MSREFWQARLEATQAQIILYEDAIMQLSTGAVQSYSLNTSQTTQTVTRFDLNRLQVTLDSLYNRYATLKARIDGCGTINAGAAW